MPKPKIIIVWFKRDLRIHDHAPLYEASKYGLPVLPLYVIEPDYWKQPFASRRHWHFIHDCLLELQQDCAALGQALVFRIGETLEILQQLADNYDIHAIHAHEESGNAWTYRRDKAIIKWCDQNAIKLHEYPCNGVVRRLKTRDDWSKLRNARMAQSLITTPQQLVPVINAQSDKLPAKDDSMFGEPVPGITQVGGRQAAIETVTSFLQERGKEYLFRLSAPGPSEKYSSRLSPHLAWGTLSVREVVKFTQTRRKELSDSEAKAWKRNLSAFSSRLSWRCHFIQKIEDQPCIEFQCMHSAYEGVREAEHNEEYFQAWMHGKTGYPLIDACMRNLIYEGWITFRMRAMLTSFASYNLWLDWRKTGAYLAQLFTDYEPGIHYSQLQMQSGVTGINTVRIYNPIKQSQEHSQDGEFIRKWVPELKNVSTTWIHEPWLMNITMQKNAHCVLGEDYPYPIVDHLKAVKSAREKLSVARKKENFKNEAKQVYNKLGSRKRPSQKNRKKTSAQMQLL